MWIYHILFIHSSVDGYMSCFHILALVNSAAVNIPVQVLRGIYVVISVEYIPRSGRAGSGGEVMVDILGNRQTALHRVVPFDIPTSSV